MTADDGKSRRGLAALVTAFGIWGLMPLYLHPLRTVPPLQVTANRLVWCCLVVLAWLAVRGELRGVRDALRSPPVRNRLLLTAILVSVNWLTYVWAVTNGRVVESSLGYFINPLVNVALGVVVLHERLNRAQWTSVALALAGVAYLTWLGGAVPWIALVLAFSFGTYGLLRKVVAVDAMVGLGTETLLLAPFGLGYVLFCELGGEGALLHRGAFVTSLLLAGGLFTAVPLALFSFGARRVPYATVGLVQYTGPTMQLVLGVFLYGEGFPPERAVGFAFIWAALALYAADGVVRARRE